MKKYKNLIYLFLILVIATLGILLYENVSKGNSKNEKEKSFSEVEFLENKLVNLFNEMNHIETRNYSVSVSEISKQAEEQKSQTSSDSSQSNASSDAGSNSGGNVSGSSSEDNLQETENTTSGGNQNEQKFSLKSDGVLTNSDEINWDFIKSEVEVLYTSIPTITLDLYQLNVAQDDILGWNQEFDQLTVVVKEEKKEETLMELSKLYDYIPKFMDKVTDEELYKLLAEAKSYLFKAYSKLDSKNWNEISNDTKQTIDTYSKLMTNTNIDTSKQYIISKGYVMLNELQNAVKIQDETVFLIKYKNILEEINNL